MPASMQAKKRSSRECTRNTRIFCTVFIRAKCAAKLFLRFLLSSVFQRCSCPLLRLRYCLGGVFLTVITTSHAPFAMNNKIAGKKYLLTGR
jgi:hypothetical protein